MKKHPTLLPEIKAMLAERNPQREVAAHHVFAGQTSSKKTTGARDMFYSHEHIQLKTGEAPLTRRLSA